MTPHPFTYSRREVLCLAAGAGAVVLAGGFHGVAFAAATPAIFHATPAYAENALEPVISARTVSFHYGKHTQGYFDNANKLVADTPPGRPALGQVFVEAAKDPKLVGTVPQRGPGLESRVLSGTVCRPRAAVNRPASWLRPSGPLLAIPRASRKALSTAAVGQFGSGWAWLVADGSGALKVVATGNADNPLQQGFKPLWVIDVWEHAYYLDYQNKRADYVKAVLEKLINWAFVAENLG